MELAMVSLLMNRGFKPGGNSASIKIVYSQSVV